MANLASYSQHRFKQKISKAFNTLGMHLFVFANAKMIESFLSKVGYIEKCTVTSCSIKCRLG